MSGPTGRRQLFQQLCASQGGHVPSTERPGYCGTCGATIEDTASVAGKRYLCGFNGCGYGTDVLADLAAHDVLSGHPNPKNAAPRVMLTSPYWLEAPKVCGACGKTGPDDFLGEVRWARLGITGRVEGTVELQTVVYVPLHLNSICASHQGASEALTRLVGHAALPDSLEVRAVLPFVEKPEGGNHG